MLCKGCTLGFTSQGCGGFRARSHVCTTNRQSLRTILLSEEEDLHNLHPTSLSCHTSMPTAQQCICLAPNSGIILVVWGHGA